MDGQSRIFRVKPATICKSLVAPAPDVELIAAILSTKETRRPGQLLPIHS